MNKNFLSMAILCTAMMTSVLSCKKDSETAPDTSLEITVTDKDGLKVSGATVALFANETDWSKGNNQIGANKISDANGKVTFTNLSAIKYFWGVIKDCQSNLKGTNTTLLPLTANAVNKTITSISSMGGTIKLVNTSSNPYRIYINDIIVDNSMAGGTTTTISGAPLGNYTIRVLQLSGYVLTPTDKTYAGAVTCGSTLTATFP